MNTTGKHKNTYIAPSVTVLNVEVCSLLAVSINSNDKNGNEEMKGEESLSKRHDTIWGTDNNNWNMSNQW